ncbi:hypothetical protein TWF730_007466 [Orbilia blumenaviensis]|uniref:Uncharacterized protein n=1 Tax=Orbilia blumenaviensis TaxID=1796055 RepID=A0AAV9V7V0_9PEZI
MSWTPVFDTYDEFQRGQSDPWENRRFFRPLDQSVDIWEKSDGSPDGVWHEHVTDFRALMNNLGEYQIRIIFAPLDIWRNAPICVPVFRTLDIPHKFISECVQTVCHSFGSQDHENGNYDGQVVVELPQADYSWLRSGFVLKSEPGGEGVTLVCFGATPYVRRRLEAWIASMSWAAITEEPYALFDLVMDGLFSEVDATSWKMADVFRPIETSILQVAKAGFPALEEHVDFIGLHNCLKHIIYLNEAVDSCLLVVDAVRDAAGGTASTQLSDSLSHRRSLFTSTSLRLSSIQRRVENTIALCFNLVSQQDSMMMRHESMVMRQDASAMKILASITVIFLPTMAVASILGSQLFLSGVVVTEDSGAKEYVEVKISPLFNMLWMLSIPMTLVIIVMAVGWSWYSHVTYPKSSEQMRQRLADNQRLHPMWVTMISDGLERTKRKLKTR